MPDLHCSSTVRELADVWCRMDAHEGQAAWAQAFGSIAAILFSGVFAVLAPIWARDVQARNTANLAGKSLVEAGQLTIAAWKMLECFLREGTLHSGTPNLLRSHLVGIREILREVPRSCRGPDAVLLSAAFENSIAVFEGALAHLDAEFSQQAAIVNYRPSIQVPFDQIYPDLEKQLANAAKLVPVRIAGVWLINLRPAS